MQAGIQENRVRVCLRFRNGSQAFCSLHFAIACVLFLSSTHLKKKDKKTLKKDIDLGVMKSSIKVKLPRVALSLALLAMTM
jgi:hypothetical protein